MADRNEEPHYPSDAIALLKTDHRKVKNLFARYESAGSFSTKHLIAEQVFTELALHAQLEENVFYPTVNEGTDEGPELVKASLAEHQTMKQLMQELRRMAHDTAEFDTKFQELIRNVEHHVEEEEAEMFPLAEEELAADLDEMSEEMQELKADLQGS